MTHACKMTFSLRWGAAFLLERTVKFEYDVFISYAYADREWAKRVRDSLRSSNPNALIFWIRIRSGPVMIGVASFWQQWKSPKA